MAITSNVRPRVRSITGLSGLPVRTARVPRPWPATASPWGRGRLLRGRRLLPAHEREARPGALPLRRALVAGGPHVHHTHQPLAGDLAPYGDLAAGIRARLERHAHRVAIGGIARHAAVERSAPGA